MVDERERGLLEGLLEDGRPAIQLTAVGLFLSGAFALFLSARREFLPHDVAFLGMSAEQLCALAECRVVFFMFHDRVAFGGSLLAVAVLYMWLAAFPLRQGLAWAWWAIAISGVLGFASFLTYLGYGYLDSWHGVATLALLPVFVVGLARSRSRARIRADAWLPSPQAREASLFTRLGRWGLVATGAGMMAAGSTILFLGSTDVFVATDLEYMRVTREALDQVNPRLVPLIAHDRAGFGGGLTTAGLLVSLCAWYARPSRSFYQAVLMAGLAGFGCAIVVHYLAGYTNVVHLAPAFAGAAMFTASMLLEAVGARVNVAPSLVARGQGDASF
jgi:hypothetical protein